MLNEQALEFVLDEILLECGAEVHQQYIDLVVRLKEEKLFYNKEQLLMPLYFFNCFDLKVEKKDKFFHLLLLSLWNEVDKGSLCLSLSKEFFLEESIEKLKKTHFIECKALADFSVSEKPLVLVSKNEEECLLYFNKQWNTYVHLVNEVSRFSFYQDNPRMAEISREELELNLKKDMSFTLNDEQKEAVIHSLKTMFTLIEGGPGTGKTTITALILDQILKHAQKFNQDIHILFLAPTGRATGKIAETLMQGSSSNLMKEALEKQQIQIQTIHRFLANRKADFKEGTDFYYYRLDYLVIDEISMVSPDLFKTLLKWISPKTKCLLLGDPLQIPSVEAGDLFEFFHSISSEANKEEVFIKRLTKLIRSENESLSNLITYIQESTIDKTPLEEENIFLQILLRINRKGVKKNLFLEKKVENLFQEIDSQRFYEILKSSKEDGVYFLPLDLKNINLRLPSFYKDLFEEFYLKFYKEILPQFKKEKTNSDLFLESLDKIFDFLSSLRLLSPLKEGLMGSLFINHIFTDLYQEQFVERSGLPIMIQENNLRLELFNGDIGVIKKEDSIEYAFFKKDGELKKYILDDLPLFEVVFASTIHKSQGSEYQKVILLLPESTPYTLVNKQIFYTGISRAKKKVFIISSKIKLEENLSFAMSRKNF